MDRRQFVKSGSAAGLIVAAFGSRAFAATDSRIEISLNESLGTISPNIYGHFTENLGALVYDGIWVGEDSRIPNINGIRRELVERMRLLKPPIIRWPGGCFADSYDWRDGVGPKKQRPRRTNFWADNPEMSTVTRSAEKFDPNQFGSAEFAHFCKLVGAQPYFAANLRSLPAEQFHHWVEYCNSPAGSTTLADLRAADGSREPFPVLYWGIGNEAWGCGGNFTPEEYATEWRRFVSWVPRYGFNLSLVASGPNGDDRNWTHAFLEGVVKKGSGLLKDVYGISLHHYAWNLSRGKTQDWNKGKGDALDFAPVDWYELLRQGEQMEEMIIGHWNVMGEIDRNHLVKLVVDEWGPWYRPGSAPDQNYVLGQQSTLRDAALSAMTLDIFNRHPEKVGLACNAQLMNCLNSLFFSQGDKLVLTPVYHVFQMYAAHQGKAAVRGEFSSPTVTYDRDGQKAAFWSLKGSASMDAANKRLIISVVNADTEHPHEAEIVIRGGRALQAEITSLSHRDIHAHNSFTEPETVRPQTTTVSVAENSLVHTFAPASVTVMKCKLG